MSAHTPSAHSKTYLLYMLVPRQDGIVRLREEGMTTQMGRYEFGKLPAASAMEAIDTYWKNCPHVGPSLLNAQGAAIRRSRIKRKQIRAELCAPDPERAVE